MRRRAGRARQGRLSVSCVETIDWQGILDLVVCPRTHCVDTQGHVHANVTVCSLIARSDDTAELKSTETTTPGSNREFLCQCDERAEECLTIDPNPCDVEEVTLHFVRICVCVADFGVKGKGRNFYATCYCSCC